MRLSLSDIEVIKRRYVNDLEGLGEIASDYSVTRQCLWKRLCGVGFRFCDYQRVVLVCDNCGSGYDLRRSEARRQRGQLHHFCSKACYFNWLENRESVMNRHGSRVGRGKVGEVFDLRSDNIVHHVDGNQLNNLYSNLAVFRNQGDHIRYHRGFDVAPIWCGCDDRSLRGL